MRLAEHCDRIWGSDAAADLPDRLAAAVGLDPVELDRSATRETTSSWSESDVVLITYGDSIVGDDRPLRELEGLLRNELAEAFGLVHILPFAPSSSDRGFAVVDHHAVDPALGDWTDIDSITAHHGLMADLVCNHVSAGSEWARQFVADTEPGRRYIRTVSPGDDLTAVVRPRSLPLTLDVETAAGPRTVWTTFSADQFDLDWSEPDVAVEMLSVIDRCLRHGASFLRLDAVAYLWKEAGSPSIHLPETHEIVKLFRTLLDARAPGTVLITETNVPDAENRSYFGAGDEAHAVYNFTLPPLLVEAIANERTDRLAAFLQAAPTPPPGATMFNLVASHDGIGLRPAEGWLTDEDIDELVARAEAAGGRHGTYDRAGEARPYEINVSLPDLFGGVEDPLMPDRVVLAHLVMLGLAGIPAVYVNSLLATTNDLDAVRRDGVRRSINRGSVSADAIPPAAAWSRRIYEGIRHACSVRRRHGAFHPDADQEVSVHDGVLVVRRRPATGPTVEMVANLSSSVADRPRGVGGLDLLTDRPVNDEGIRPWGVEWTTRA